MKSEIPTLQEQVSAVLDAVIALQEAQLATMAWLTAVGKKHSAQLVSELKAEHANVKWSQKKLRQLLKKLPKQSSFGRN